MTDRVVRVVLRGSVTGLIAPLRAASRSVGDLTTQMTRSGREAEQYRRNLSTVGASAGGIGLAAAAGLGAIVVASANFDQAMSNVAAATHETSENMDQLREAALKAGAQTVYSASEAAGAIEALAKAGVSTADILAGGLSGALNLAASDGLEVAEAAEIAASAMTQFSLAGTEVAHISDLLAAGAGKAQGGVSDLGQALNQSGLVASQTGLSIEETVGALAEFASAGLIGSDAGTSFKTMLQALNPNSEQAAKAMSKLGISAYDAQGNFVGMTQFAESLQNGLKDLSVEQQNATLKTIFGSDAVRAAAIIFKDGAEGVSKWQGNVNDAGYAAETAGLRLDNLKGDVEALKGSLETALIGSGDGSQGALRKITQDVTGVVNAYNKLPPAVQSSTAALLGLTAVTGGALFLGSVVIGRIAATRTALQGLGVTAVQTRTALAAVGQGLALGALVIGIQQVTKALGHAADTTDLGRNLEALANGAKVADFKGVASDIARLNSGLEGSTEFLSETASLFGIAGDTNLDKAEKNINNIDQALAGMVESGNAEQAALAFEHFIKMAEENGTSRGDAAKNFDAYSTALKNSKVDTDDATAATEGNTTAATENAEAQKAAAKALEVNRKAARKTADSFVGLGSEVDNTKVSLDDWIRSMEIQAAALRNFTSNAITAGKKGLRDGLIKELEAAGPAGALRMRELANGTQAQIHRANAAFDAGRNAVKSYTDTIGGIPKPTITVKTASAIASINRIRSMLFGLPAVVPLAIAAPKYVPNPGGTDGDPRTPMAGGGRVRGPGGPKDDLIPAWLSNNEFVMPADAVAFYGLGTMEAMRAKRFADGGSAGGAKTTPGGYGSVRSELHDFRIQLKASAQSIEKERNERDDLVSKRDGLVETIKNAFTRDLFTTDRSDSVWLSAQDRKKANVGTPIETLQQDIANGRAFQQQLKTLKAKGLSGDAYAELAASGDLQQVTDFAGQSKAQLAYYQHLFNQRAQVAEQTGRYGGTAAYGKDITAANKSLAAMERTSRAQTKILARLEALEKKNPHATGAEVGRVINGAASTARRRST